MASFAEASFGLGFRAPVGPVGLSIDTRSSEISYQPDLTKQKNKQLFPPVKWKRTKMEKAKDKVTMPITKIVFQARQWLNQTAF